MSEDFEEDEVLEDEEGPSEVEYVVEVPSEVEYVIEAPFADSGYYLYVCSQCGSPLTEIPAYNRFLCENCGLHY